MGRRAYASDQGIQKTGWLIPFPFDEIKKSQALFRLGSVLAERKRFELSIQLPVYYLSRVAPSTTRTPLCIYL